MLVTKFFQHLPSIPTALSSAPAAATVALAGGVLSATLVGGSGQVSTEIEDLPPFTGIEVWDLDAPVLLAVHSNLPTHVTVSCDDGLDTLMTRVRGGTLVIGGTSSEPVSVSVSLPDLERLVLFGDVRASVRSIHAQEFSAILADTARLDAQGEVRRLEVVVDAQGHALLHDLVSQEATVTASGSSRVDLSVQTLLTATAFGGAGVFYFGHPEVKQNVHGTAHVSPSTSNPPAP
jgi:hypothetical protein